MRTSVIVATTFVLLSTAYRYYARNQALTPKTVLSWGTVLITLSLIGNTQFSQFSDTIAYIIILIIILNDGYDFMQSVSNT